MEIKSTLTNRSGQILDIVYRESDPLLDLEDKILEAVHAYCFCGDNLVVVHSEEKGYWTLPGGRIEEEESYEEATVREVLEETNMKVVYQKLIGYQDIYESNRVVRQTRSFCAVESLGEFISDPDGEITAIKLIKPEDYKQYVDWGEVGDHIFKRVINLKNQFTSNIKFK